MTNEEQRAHEAAEAQTRAEELAKRIEDRARFAKLPPLHWSRPINFAAMGEHAWVMAYRKVVAHLENPGATVLLLGICGAGKSQLAVEVARARFTSDRPGCGSLVYASADGLQDDLRDASCSDTRSLCEAMNRYIACGLLIVDEIDKRAETTWGEAKLLRIIDERYQHQRRTMIIGNILPDGLAKSLGPSAADRLRETGLLVEATWGSFRRQARR